MADKILYLHETSRLSGAENSLLNLARFIDKSKFIPVFACPGGGLFSDLLAPEGFKVYHMEFPRVRNIFGVSRAVGKLRNVIRMERISIVHSNSIRTHIYAALAGRSENIFVVWHERNMLDKEIVDPDRIMSFLPDRIVCNSRAIASRFNNGKKVRVIHNGVDITLFNPEVDGTVFRKTFSIDSGDILIGMIGRLNANKDQHTFLYAIKHLFDISPEMRAKVKFMIIGAGVFDEDSGREDILKKEASGIGIGDSLIFTGFFSDMPQVYAAMDIVVIASIVEGCSRVAIEAMASGVPVIGTNSGGTPEIVKNGSSGFLFKPGDYKALAMHMHKLIEDKNLRSSMASFSRQRAESLFSIMDNVRKTESLYEELMCKHGE